MHPPTIDPRVLDAMVRAAMATLIAEGSLRLCDPRCRAAVRGLVRRTLDAAQVIEQAEGHAQYLRERDLG